MRITHCTALSCLLAALAVAEEAPRGGRIGWERDVERGLREAAETDRPAMLYFTDDR